MILRALAVAIVVIVPFVLGTTGCDQLNKPLGHPQSPSLTSSSSSSSGDGGSDFEGGMRNDDDAPIPGIKAQPGDIQL
jgi:hypothetical protein